MLLGFDTHQSQAPFENWLINYQAASFVFQNDPIYTFEWSRLSSETVMIASLKMGLPKKSSCLYDHIQRLENHVLVSEQQIPIVSSKRTFKKG